MRPPYIYYGVVIRVRDLFAAGKVHGVKRIDSRGNMAYWQTKWDRKLWRHTNAMISTVIWCKKVGAKWKIYYIEEGTSQWEILGIITGVWQCEFNQDFPR